MTLSFVTIPKPRQKAGERGNLEHRRRLMTPSQKRSFAHGLIGSARAYKRLVDQPCCVCGIKKAHAHHENYDDPYTVAFLCSKHHMERHRELGWGIPGRRPAGGRKPRRADLAIITLRIPESLRARLESAAAESGRTISSFIRHHFTKLLNAK